MTFIASCRGQIGQVSASKFAYSLGEHMNTGFEQFIHERQYLHNVSRQCNGKSER
jgi:hypothetical protein